MATAKNQSEVAKKAWKTIRANESPEELQKRQKEAGRKMAVTKLKNKISNVILTSASLKLAEQAVIEILEKSPQLK